VINEFIFPLRFSRLTCGQANAFEQFSKTGIAAQPVVDRINVLGNDKPHG